jgi:transposase
MSNQRFSPEFNDEAVRQIVDRGYSVPKVSERLGVSAHSLYKWVKAVKLDKTDAQASALIGARSEVMRLRSPLKRSSRWISTKSSLGFLRRRAKFA